MFRKMKSLLIAAILYAAAPFLLALILIIILFFNICRYFYKWLAYGMTALRAVLVIFGESESEEIDMDELGETIEFTGFVYDLEQDIFYSEMDAWQRNFGYCRLYDEAAAIMGMIVDCEPIHFDYNGKKWLIEFWKGQYDLTTGCEIGVYSIEEPTFGKPGFFNGTFYNSVSDANMLPISYALKKNDKTLLIRADKHWWLTGFKLGEFSQPDELKMEINISLKDFTMLNAFVNGLYKAGYSAEEINQNGLTVSFLFDKPKTPQPFTRTIVTDWFIQKKNKYLCTKYQDITGTSNTMPEKLKAIQQKAPRMYGKIINIGKTKELYQKYQRLNNYLN